MGQAVTNEMLLKAGFVERGESDLSRVPLFSKRTTAGDMPYLNDHVVGDFGITERSPVIVTVTDEGVSFRIYHQDLDAKTGLMTTALYSEPAVTLESDFGNGVLKDAGVVFA